MCKIYETRRSNKFVYIELDDEATNYYGVKKIAPKKYDFAKKFGMDFLSLVSKETTIERDENDAITAVPFHDELIPYATRT